MPAPKVLVIGAGAIGGFYGALLAKAGAEVSVVCRSDYDHVRQHGFSINSFQLGAWIFKPAQVLKQVDEYQQSADYVLLCTKVTPSVDRVSLLRSALSPTTTTLVFIQNGVDIEHELVTAFPDNEIISGLAFICSNRTSAGAINHLAYGRLTLGPVSNRVSTKYQQLVQLFNSAGIECKPSNAITTDRWKKCVWNAPFNPLSVLSGGLATLAILQTQETLVRKIMAEVCEIAAAAGHPLPEDIIAFNITSTYEMPPYKTSMLIDYEAGNTLETEAIIGNVVRSAHRSGVACPHLETIYGLMELRALQLKA